MSKNTNNSPSKKRGFIRNWFSNLAERIAFALEDIHDVFGDDED